MTRSTNKEHLESMPATRDPKGPANPRRSIREIFLSHDGNFSDKWEQYLSVYEMELSHFSSSLRPVNLLEIGVQNGGSLEVWEKFLPPGSAITGVDIDVRCRRLALRGNITLMIGDAADPDALDRLLGEQRFDIIVDDGSHRQTDIISTFRTLFRRLVNGGIYFIEDLHASYWQSHGGGLRKPGSAIEFLKGMVDAQHFNHIEGNDPQAAAISTEVQALNSEVARIAFYDSIAVVNKYPTPRTRPFRRIVSGTRMLVTPLSDYVNTLVGVPGAFSAIGGITDELLHESAAELSRVKAELASLKAVHESETELRSQVEALRAELGEQQRQVEAQRVELSDRDTSLNGLQAELGAQQGQVEAQRLELSDRDTRLNGLQAELAEHQMQAEARRIEWAGLELQLNSLRAALAERQATGDRLEAELKDHEERGVALSKDLADGQMRLRDAELRIGAQRALFEEREASVKRLRAERDALLEREKAVIEDRDQVVEARRREIAERDAGLALLSSELVDWRERAETLIGQISPRLKLADSSRRPETGRSASSALALAQRDRRLTSFQQGLERVASRPLRRLERSLENLIRRLSDLARGKPRWSDESRIRTSGLFDESYYLEQNPDVWVSGIDAVSHYVAQGALEGRDPHPLFDTSFYLAQNPDVLAAGVNPLIHFTTNGAFENRDPHPLFDLSYYLAQNADVRGAGVNPLLHFLAFGAAEGRDPNPLFNASFYLENPDVRRAGVNPLEHYARWGFSEGRNPHPLFDTSYYLEQYPDVLEAAINPLAHYLSWGGIEGRDPHPLFDTSFYLEENADVRAAGLNPLHHFYARGAAEGRNPSPLFDTRYYLLSNPDVREDGVNPLYHFASSGAAQGRHPHPAFEVPKVRA